VGNVINFSKTVGVITPKTFVKNTAKGAGKGIVDEYRSKKSNMHIFFQHIQFLSFNIIYLT